MSQELAHAAAVTLSRGSHEGPISGGVRPLVELGVRVAPALFVAQGLHWIHPRCLVGRVQPKQHSRKNRCGHSGNH